MPQGAQEPFPVSLIFNTIRAMFVVDARKAGADLRIVPTDAALRADPLSVMRIIGNLVANALRHSGADRIVLGVRHTGGGIRLKVHDNGVGMAQATAAEQGWTFQLTSHQGRGTVGSLALPVLAPSLAQTQDA